MKWDFKIHFSPKKEFLNQIEKNDVNWISKDFIMILIFY